MTRKERSDKGSIRINARDFRCLSWLLEMSSAYEEDLAIVLDPARLTSPNAAKAVLRRWRQADLVQAEGLFANRGRIVRLTDDGARLVGEVDHSAAGPVTAAVHTAEVARTRLLLEHRPPLAGIPVVGWVGARHWRDEHEPAVLAGAHVPDGVARLADGSCAAVQVERVNHGISAAIDVATDLLRRFPRVVYAVPAMSGGVAAVIESAVAAAAREIRFAGAEPATALVISIPDRLRGALEDQPDGGWSARAGGCHDPAGDTKAGDMKRPPGVRGDPRAASTCLHRPTG
ncbi:hypothetical protein [Parafrankia discariae]|uniref:hypothetical protein n=1 Tax=Parafrankia discariae TaxID=365528 RepID=UPI0003721100|nr:hypothetical protein [Parafrankia discariae]